MSAALRINRLVHWVLLSVLVCSASCKAQTSAETHMVAMSDGVKLATDVYLPAKGKRPFPTLLLRTPYNKNGNRGDR